MQNHNDLKCIKTGCSVYSVERREAFWGDLFVVKYNDYDERDIFLFKYNKGSMERGDLKHSQYGDHTININAFKILFVDESCDYGIMIFEGVE